MSSKLKEVTSERISKRLPANYLNLFDIARAEGIPISKVKAAICEEKENGIRHIKELQPIAHLFRAFNVGGRNSYGIYAQDYYFFRQHGFTPKKEKRKKVTVKPETVSINFPIPVKLYETFKKVVENGNKDSLIQITLREAVYLAMKEYIERRPELLIEE